jgi:hypothetical protein
VLGINSFLTTTHPGEIALGFKLRKNISHKEPGTCSMKW